MEKARFCEKYEQNHEPAGCNDPENCHLSSTNCESFKTSTQWSTVKQTQMYDKLTVLTFPHTIYIHRAFHNVLRDYEHL
jgi:hypothetical protein